MGVVLVFKGGREVGRREAFGGDAVKVGSSPAADLIITDDPFVEREHFVIERVTAGSYQVRDLHTQHGTFINGRKISSAGLHDEDVIRVGLTMLQSLFTPDMARAPAVALAGAVDEAFEPLTPARGDDLQMAVTGAVGRRGGSATPRERVGAAVADQGYDLGRLLGRGSFGRVYKATQCADGTSVAIKVLDSIPSESPRQFQLFLREIAVHRKLEHPHIVQLLSTGGLDERIAWFVMEYVEARSLDEMIRSAGAKFSVPDACAIACQIFAP